MSQRLRREPTEAPLDLVRRKTPQLPNNSLIGQIIGLKYEIQSELGKGNVGIVYRAKDNKTGKIVAIKFMEDNGSTITVDTFLKEANYLRQLDHPNILKCFDAGVHNQNGKKMYYIVTELLNGESLDTKLSRRLNEDKGPFRWEEIRQRMKEVADALYYMHKQGIVHRDIKPDNILVVVENGNEVVKIVDFGIARRVDERHDPPGITSGTPYYMGPERTGTSGKAIEASDQYSFGIMMYELLTGKMPIGEDVNNNNPAVASINILIRQQIEQPKKPRELEGAQHIPKDVQKIIMTCLEKKERDRFLDMEEVADEISSSRKKSYSAKELERMTSKSRSKTGKIRNGTILAFAAIIISIATICAIAIRIKDPELFNKYMNTDNSSRQNLQSAIHIGSE